MFEEEVRPMPPGIKAETFIRLSTALVTLKLFSSPDDDCRTIGVTFFFFLRLCFLVEEGSFQLFFFSFRFLLLLMPLLCPAGPDLTELPPAEAPQEVLAPMQPMVTHGTSTSLLGDFDSTPSQQQEQRADPGYVAAAGPSTVLAGDLIVCKCVHLEL